MPKIHKVCQLCGKSYDVFPCFANTTKYCSKLCRNKANALSNAKRFVGKMHWRTGKKYPRKEKVAVKCQYCTTSFDCYPSEYNNGRRHCSKECVDKGKAVRGENSKRIWRRESERLYGYACEKCGEKDERIDVHHIDRNRKNNPENGSNWMRLCDKCHKLIHKMMRDRAPIIGRTEFIT